MLIDFNMNVGSYPFRKMKYNNLPGLIDFMERTGIDKGIISSLEALNPWGCHKANLKLMQAVAKIKKKKMLIPVPVINPCFPGWEKNLDFYINRFRIKGIKLFPGYHCYSLVNPEFVRLIEKIAEVAESRHSGSGSGSVGAELSLFAGIVFHFEDERLAPWVRKPDFLKINDLITLAEKWKKVNFIIMGISYGEFSNEFSRIAKLKNIHLEISFVEGVGTIENSVRALGSKRILFGSNLPFFYPQCSLAKLEEAEISSEQREDIEYKNALNLLHRVS